MAQRVARGAYVLSVWHTNVPGSSPGRNMFFLYFPDTCKLKNRQQTPKKQHCILSTSIQICDDTLIFFDRYIISCRLLDVSFVALSAPSAIRSQCNPGGLGQTLSFDCPGVAYDFGRSGLQLENRVSSDDGGLAINVSLIEGHSCGLTSPSIAVDNTVTRGLTSLNVPKGTGIWLDFDSFGSTFVGTADSIFSLRMRVK